MTEALEALYGFTMWIVKAAVVLAAVGALIAIPVYLVSLLWHRLIRGDRRCPECKGWFRGGAGETTAPSRCGFCRGEVTAALAEQPARPSGA